MGSEICIRDRVKGSIMFRGTEMDHPEIGMGLLKAVAEDLIDDAMLERQPTFEGRVLAMILTPNLSRETKKENNTKEINSAKT